MSLSMTLQAVDEAHLDRFLNGDLPLARLTPEQRCDLESAWDVLLYLIDQCPPAPPYNARDFLEGEFRPDVPLDGCIVLRPLDVQYANQVLAACTESALLAQLHSPKFAALPTDELYHLASWRDPANRSATTLCTMLTELRTLFAHAEQRQLAIFVYML